QRLAGQQRDVAVGDDDDTVELGQLLEGNPDRVPGAELFFLHHRARRGRDLVEVGRDQVASVPDDHRQMVRFELLGGRDGMAHEGPSGQFMQNLGDGRPHPGALAGGEDNDGGRARSHAFVLLGFGGWTDLDDTVPRHGPPTAGRLIASMPNLSSRERIRTPTNWTKTSCAAITQPGTEARILFSHDARASRRWFTPAIRPRHSPAICRQGTDPRRTLTTKHPRST